MKTEVPWRKNVLFLVGVGYTTVLLMFGVAVVGTDSISAAEAYDMLEGPLMALIGGSLAISKDLVPLGENANTPVIGAVEQGVDDGRGKRDDPEK